MRAPDCQGPGRTAGKRNASVWKRCPTLLAPTGEQKAPRGRCRRKLGDIASRPAVRASVAASRGPVSRTAGSEILDIACNRIFDMIYNVTVDCA